MPPIRKHLKGIGWLVLLMTLTLGWRVAAPSDIDDNEQPITLAQFFDAAIQGHWLVQFNPFEGLSTKPPLYHWLGAWAYMTTGVTREWGLKLASILPWLATTGLVVAIARTSLPGRASLLAGGLWVANFHTVKLGYTARPDMALAMFMAVALLAMLIQRPMWQMTPLEPPYRAKYGACWAIFWLAIALAGMTKGPPALIVAAFMFFLLIWDRAWRKPHHWLLGVGLLAAVGSVLVWLGLTLHHYPEWNQILDDELWDRLGGEETNTKIYPPRWREIHYFMGRFIPWSILVVAGMILLPWWRRPARVKLANSAQVIEPASDKDIAAALAPAIQWAAFWVLVVLFLLALPKGRRADHILPVHAGAVVLAAAVVELAHRKHQAARMVASGLLTGVLVVAAIYALAALLWLPGPAPMNWVVASIPLVTADFTPLVTWSAAGVGLLSCGVGAFCLGRGRIHPAAWAGVFAMAAIIGLFNNIHSRAAQHRHGDYVVAFAHAASAALQREGRQPIFYDTGYVPVQSLMGHHVDMLTYQPIPGNVPGDVPGALVITSLRGWSTLEAAGARGEIILQTPQLAESDHMLLLVRPTSLPDSLPGPARMD